MRRLRRTAATLAVVFAVVAVAAFSIGGLWWIFAGEAAPESVVGNANVVAGLAAPPALLLALVAVVGPVWQSRRRPVAATPEQLDAAVGYLAAAVHADWKAEADRRRVTTPVPAVVRWEWAGSDLAADAVDVAPQALTAGAVTEIRDQLYRRLRHGRLVILGDPGAGKTTTMLLLLLKILESEDPGPVPVWLTLGSWNPETVRLEDHLTRVLRRDYPLLASPEFGGVAVVEQLFRAGRLALFLDGLDELPLGLQAAALSKINAAGALAEVVLTSRFHAYKQALTGARLWRTAVVEVLPVEGRQAGEFLLAEQLGDRRRQWQQVADLLVARPESVTARTLTTPLALSLARDVYAEEPARLVDADGFTSERELQRNLLRQSVLRAFPGPGGETARWWLARLAQRMGDGRSLSWTGIPVLVIRESMDLRLSVVAAVSAICLVTGGLVMSVLNVIVPVNQIVALCLMPGMMAFPVAVSAAHRPIWWQLHSKVEPLVLRPRAVVVAYVLLAIFMAVMNHSIAMIIMDLSLSATAPITAIVVGFLITVSGPAMFRAAPGNADSIRDVSPEEIYSSARRRLIERVLLTSTCATVAVAALFLSSVWETSPLLVSAVAVVTTFGCCIFALSLGQSLGPVIGLAVVELALLPTGRRVSFMKLLRQAADRQVLRQAGRVYQFRHAELQDLLADLDTDGDPLVRAAPAADR